MSLSADTTNGITTASKAATTEPERIALPTWIKEAQTWLVATERLAKALEAEDASLTADVRQVRGLRKLIDAVLDRVEPRTGDRP